MLEENFLAPLPPLSNLITFMNPSLFDEVLYRTRSNDLQPLFDQILAIDIKGICGQIQRGIF